jgi:nitrogenase molybdenum-iron protein alpha/beta subunit
MVNNSTNINRAKNHLSTQVIEQKKTKKTQRWNPYSGLHWDRHKTVAGYDGILNLSIEIINLYFSYF